MRKANATLKGNLNSVSRVLTRTSTPMVTFSVDKTPCKVFGENAEVLLGWAPGNLVEVHGYYETHSPKFGREFVAVRGQLLRPESGSAPAVTVPEGGTVIDEAETAKGSVPSPSSLIEPVPANEPIGVKTELPVTQPSTPLSSMPPGRRSRPADEFVRARAVTFEDLENQYKSLKAAREIEGLNRPGNNEIEGMSVA